MTKYFISYFHQVNNGFGYGNIESNHHKEIEGIKDVSEIARSIEKDLNLADNSLVIINFIKLS